MFRKNIFILGAGFSANAGAPVMWNFIERAKHLRDDPGSGLPPDDYKTFGRVFERLSELRVAQAKMAIDIENIENFFSLADMDIEFGGASAGTLRRDLILVILRTLERTISTVDPGTWTLRMRNAERGIHQRNISANYVEIFSALASRRWIGGPLGIPNDGNCQDVVITMNYDCLVDDCLVQQGIQPEYGLEHPDLPPEFKSRPFRMPILKLHGSANWFQCNSERCRGKISIDAGTPAERLEYFYGKRCSRCHQEMEPMIVPPSWAKGGQSEVLRPVWSKALKALRQAGRIFIIGYSMPPTDEFFRYLLALALATNEQLDKVIVVNPSKEAQQTFAKLLQPQFAARKLIPEERAIAAYVIQLGNELGQFQHGLDEKLIETSKTVIVG